MKKNIGLDLLRVWLSFEVVIDHFWHQKGLSGVWAFLSSKDCFIHNGNDNGVEQ